MKRSLPALIALGILVLLDHPALAAMAESTTPMTWLGPGGQTLPNASIVAEGKAVLAWQTSAQAPTLSFGLTEASAPADSTPTRFLKIAYLDSSYGHLSVSFKNAAGQWSAPDKSMNLVLLDTGRVVTAYQRCTGTPAAAFQVRIKLEKPSTEPLSILEVAAQPTPFTDGHFQFLLDEAWKRPYAGPSLPGIDNHKLKNRVMVGYQGWFRTPNDPYNGGWFHWGDMDRKAFTTDMWPDVSLYPADCLDKASDVKTLSGKTAFLFSPGWPEVVRAHFALMRAYDIDGAFVQRFVSADHLFSVDGRSPEWVLGNVRAAANQEGRIWAVEYDVSGCSDERLLDLIKTDWIWLIDHFGIRQDPSYAHEDDKPVVFVWGMSLPDRHISLATADAVVNFLKHDPTYGGSYVIGGIPTDWRRTLDEGWRDHIARYDAAQSWQSTDYTADREALRQLGVTHYGMAWPGFSWANLKHLPTGSTDAYSPRAGGAFYEAQLAKAATAQIDRLFIGMFDEYDEGTALLPMSDDPPPTNRQPGTNARFFPNTRWAGEPRNSPLAQIDLPLDGTSPGKGVDGTRFSARFRGQLMPTLTGPHIFAVKGAPGDSATLWVDDQRLDIDSLSADPAPQLTVPLTAGRPVLYKLDYRHEDQVGRLQLCWQPPDGTMEVIPAPALQDAWGRFITNEGKPADWWLTLTKRWRDTAWKAAADPPLTSAGR